MAININVIIPNAYRVIIFFIFFVMFLKSVVETNIKLAQLHCSNNNCTGILAETMSLGDHSKITTKCAEKNESQQMIAIS